MHNEPHQQYKNGNESPTQEEGRDSCLDSGRGTHKVRDDAGDSETNRGCRYLDSPLRATQFHRVPLESS